MSRNREFFISSIYLQFSILLLLLAILAGCGTKQFGSDRKTVRRETVKPMVYMCSSTSPQIEPPELLACGAFAGINVIWSSWGTEDAWGKGILQINVCTPDCANGHYNNYPANFKLLDPIPAGHHIYFTKLTVTYNGKQPGYPAVTTYSVKPPCATPKAPFPPSNC
jgi:hypothetical protein